MRRGYLVAFFALVVVVGLAVVVARTADPSDIGGKVDVRNLPVLAGEVAGPGAAAGWIGSKPLTAASLHGSVVVYDFWTYSCVNCVRTLPFLRSWYDRYRGDGLVIVGVHSPEFEFEKDPANVRRAVAELHVDWPVALDPDMKIWQAFANRYWPAKYVVDRSGRLRFVHFGEGSYTQTEDVLRQLLGVGADAPRAKSPDGENSGASDDAGQPAVGQTPETYLGNLRGTTESPQGLSDPDHDGTSGGEADFTVPDHLASDAFALDGRWSINGESATALEPGAAIVLRYQAREVNLVLAAGDRPSTTVRVTVDDGAPRSVAVGGPDLVNLLEHGPTGEHTMRIEATTAGVAAYAFTFG